LLRSTGHMHVCVGWTKAGQWVWCARHTSRGVAVEGARCHLGCVHHGPNPRVPQHKPLQVHTGHGTKEQHVVPRGLGQNNHGEDVESGGAAAGVREGDMEVKVCVNGERGVGGIANGVVTSQSKRKREGERRREDGREGDEKEGGGTQGRDR
jgi:hypothetical protein